MTKCTRRAALLAAPLLLAVGCSVNVPVEYSPLAAADTLVEPGEQPANVYVVSFKNELEDAEQIGSWKNSLGLEKKKIVTDSPIGRVFAEACTDALNKAGLRASLHSDRKTGEAIPDSALRGYEAIVGGAVRTLHTVVRPRFSNADVISTVEMEVQVTKNGQTDVIGPIEGTARKSLPAVTWQDLSSVTNLAIQNAMRNMIRHLRASGALR